jgi:hypothetical protein
MDARGYPLPETIATESGRSSPPKFGSCEPLYKSGRRAMRCQLRILQKVQRVTYAGTSESQLPRVAGAKPPLSPTASSCCPCHHSSFCARAVLNSIVVRDVRLLEWSPSCQKEEMNRHLVCLVWLQKPLLIGYECVADLTGSMRFFSRRENCLNQTCNAFASELGCVFMRESVIRLR